MLTHLYQIPTSTEFQLTLETQSFDLSTFTSISIKPNSTYQASKTRKWVKWVLQLQWLSWFMYTRYLHLLSSIWLWRLTALTWIPSQAPQRNRTEFAIGQRRKSGSSGYYGFSVYADPSIPVIFLYCVPADSRDLQLWPKYLPKHLDPIRQNLQGVKVK